MTPGEWIDRLERRMAKFVRTLQVSRARKEPLPPILLRVELEHLKKLIAAVEATCLLEGENPYPDQEASK
jgi:hypothetical protein